MRQLVYISTIDPRSGPVDPSAILSASRRNNARARVTGALWFDGRRFLQALEGEDAMVDETFRRIQQDTRHKALVVLFSREIEQREFGEWAMASRPTNSTDTSAVDRIEMLTKDAAPEVRATFESFAKIRRAA